MKKIIIVNNNMKVGGVQKSLYNLLHAISGQYDVTLFLFRTVGEYMDKLPSCVKVVECSSLFRYLGVSQGECSGADKLKRGLLAAVCKLFGRSAVMKILLSSQKILADDYDCAISYLHNGNERSFYGGVQDFVLRRIKAERKIAFLHCDYRGCGADNKSNNRSMAEFDSIAACSDGCRRAFEDVLPELSGKCVTVRNCHRFDEIKAMAECEPVCYNNSKINIIAVARLAHEKGIDRAIRATVNAVNNGFPAMLHIVGSGAMESDLRAMVTELGMDDNVRFYGQQSNPYRFMVNADMLLLSSYHEAAPMVIEEARALGLPTLTTETTSSDEMVSAAGCGWVCENSQDALDEALVQVLSRPDKIFELKEKLSLEAMDNAAAIEQLEKLLGGIT